jgi:type IV pilus assembly protein PilN
MKISINLATRPFADQGPTIKRLRIAMVVFAVVSIGLGVGLYLLNAKAQAARARQGALDGQIARINQERQGYHAMMRQPDNAQVLDQAGNLNALFDQKAFSWTLAMEDLETVLPGGVQVTALEPIRDEKTARIALKLRVVGPRDKDVELVQNLEHSHHFLSPAIVGESTESSGGPGQALEPVSASNKMNFDLTAEYNPAAIRENPAPKETAEETRKPEATAGATPLHKAAGPATGPGLRRPPFTGVARPPASKPGPGAQSPQALRQTGQPRYPATPQTQPATRPTPNSQQAPKPQTVRPGGPQ